MKPTQSEKLKRRQFLSTSFLTGASFCLGCSALLSSLASATEAQPSTDFKDRINQSAGRTFNQIFTFAYRDAILPQLVELSQELGRDKLVGMLKNATEKVCAQPGYQSRLRSTMPDQFWSNVLDVQVIENTSSSRIYKITNCLWANIFREAKAEDFGYALICYGDYAIARTNKETLERETTLMQGHDCCLLKWTKDA